MFLHRRTTMKAIAADITPANQNTQLHGKTCFGGNKNRADQCLDLDLQCLHQHPKFFQFSGC